MIELQIENIWAAYRKKEVLRGVSVSLQQSEILALIGPNGAGKSTLLKVIAGFLKPMRGSVRVDGKEISALPPHERVDLGITYFMQGGTVFPNLSVFENLEIGALRLPSDKRGENIASILEVFPNLKDLLKNRAGVLSGGERQSLALGMVMIKQPRFLLLDEPSAGLSPRLTQDVLDRIGNLNRTRNIPILLVEQKVREALNLAHRAIALIDGKVALETDKPVSWLAEGQLDAIFLGAKSKKEWL